jgi:mRNA interferase HigB
VHVISRRKLAEFYCRHADAETALDIWFRVVKCSDWHNLDEVRRVYPSADIVGKWTVFNIPGNRYRLIAEIGYRSRLVLIRHILTHAEYERGDWRK